MKHTLPVTFLLIIMFVLSQAVGLYIVSQYVDVVQTQITGEVVYTDLPTIPGVNVEIARPDVAPDYSWVFISLGILAGTGLFLLIIKFGKIKLWKAWYFLAITLTLFFALKPFIGDNLAFIAAIAVSFIKTFRPNIIVHNVSELFVYGGLAAIFVPIMNFFAAAILLILIALYDAYAVWKSKHMVAIAQFQTDSKMFAGLHFDYGRTTKHQKTHEQRTSAVLGGGDMGFPLLFTGVLMRTFSIPQVAIVVAFATIGLSILLLLSEKGKFYPAMPFIGAGCFLGYSVALFL